MSSESVEIYDLSGEIVSEKKEHNYSEEIVVGSWKASKEIWEGDMKSTK